MNNTSTEDAVMEHELLSRRIQILFLILFQEQLQKSLEGPHPLRGSREFLKQSKIGKAYFNGDYEKAVKLARKAKPRTLTSTVYLLAALKKTAYKAIDNANNSLLFRWYHLRTARKSFAESIKEAGSCWQTSNLEARMGIALTYMVGDQYDKAEKELDELNALLESREGKDHSSTKTAVPAVSSFTVLCYVDMIANKYMIGEEKWKKAARGLSIIAAHEDQEVEKRIYDWLVEKHIYGWLLPSNKNRESMAVLVSGVQDYINTDWENVFGSLYTPVVYELRRIMSFSGR